ncbi:sigma-54-dependent Fis family transcriptional regulator [Candidatus Poribacteria bacterium]|nr:sigma-54-dependent Fis family transcriptional regulator [Candidatus Poribacteria bacterium]
MSASRILVADDNHDTCHYIVQCLRMETDLDVNVEIAYDRDSALAKLRDASTPFDVVIADLWMPDSANVRDEHGGLRVLDAGRAQTPPADVLIITGNSSADTALRASLTGARDYLIKPIDGDRLVATLREILSERRAPRESVPEPVDGAETLTPIIGASPVMIEVMRTIGRVARTELDLLIVGDSGTGKELVARTIHANSARANGPFVPVNCSAIPEQLLEAELFGIGRRVATEVDARPGRFMEAEGGTLFLDEIGEVSLDVQPKLLRAIELKEIQRVGSDVAKADVRIIAATNRQLADAVELGSFRRDLYYRLTGAVIRVPSLEERREDIPRLAEHFLRLYARRIGKSIAGFDADAMRELTSRRWDGNVRELENAVEMACVRASGSIIRTQDIPDGEHAPTGRAASGNGIESFLASMSRPSMEAATDEFQRLLIEHVLRQNGGNRTHAARQLGIGRTALHRKMKQLGVQDDGRD